MRAVWSRPSFWPAVIALVAGLAVLLTGAWDPPGITLDEPINASEGMRLAEAVTALDLPRYARVSSEIPDHPPLGRLWLGLWGELAMTARALAGLSTTEIDAARTGSAAAFALTVFLVGSLAAHWWGAPAGTMAALAAALMPRAFGHAHLAALESCVNLTYVAAIVTLVRTCESGPPSLRAAAWCGVFLGLALLTKIQAIFLPPVVGLWLLIRFRHTGLLPLLTWGLVGMVVFFACWPWLWSDPVGHVLKYLGRTTDRPTILTWYWGESLKDRDVPWHYAWVTFGVSVPVLFHVLGGFGVWAAVTQRASSDVNLVTGASHSLQPRPPALALLLAAIVFPMLVFSLPGVPVYDGERLFSMVFPLWGVFVGGGAAFVWQRGQLGFPKSVGRLVLPLAGVLAVAGIIVTSPCQLSYYSPLVGMLPGADRIGLATTYWGDSFTPEFLESVAERLPERATLQVCPVMDQQWQLSEMRSCRGFRDRKIRLVPWHTHHSRYVLLFSRKDYLDDQFRRLPPPAEVGETLVEMRRQGVLLAALIRVR